MNETIMGLLGLLLKLIFEAEEKFGAGAGPEKLASVLTDFRPSLTIAAGDFKPSSINLDELIPVVIEIIELIVKLLNLLGVFKHGS